jgi:hypothetical protein
LSRSGPIVPFEFAGAKVWHEPQPFAANTVFPAAASPPPEEFVVPDVVVAAVEVASEVVGAAVVPPTVTVRTELDFPSDV